MEPRTNKDLYKIAHRFLELYTGASTLTEKLNINSFVKFYHVDFFYLKFLYVNYGILGMIATDSKLTQYMQAFSDFPYALQPDRLYLDTSLLESKRQYQKRFIVCHEMAHFFFHAFNLTDEKDHNASREETDANAFASYLLTPDELIAEKIKAPLKAHFLQGRCILLGQDDLTLTQACRSLGVERSLLIGRLLELGLIYEMGEDAFFVQKMKASQYLNERTVENHA